MSSVIRVERTHDYTVMANFHLKSKTLSLKAKGLLSTMLALPDGWNYSISGLSLLSTDGKDSIREALRELERAGYIIRKQRHSSAGKMDGYDYTVYERPEHAEPEELSSGKPSSENPMTVKSTTEEPMTGKPMSENPTQINTYQSNTYISNTYEKKYPSIKSIRSGEADADVMRMRMEIRGKIGYDVLSEEYDRARLDEIVELICEVLCSGDQKYRIAGREQPAALVKERLRQINSMHVQYVFDMLAENAPTIRNIKSYLLACLFNAPGSMSNYYSARANRDCREHEEYLDSINDLLE